MDRRLVRRRKRVALGNGASVAYPQPTSTLATAVMRGNRKRDTRPEIALRRLLHAAGSRYRVNSLLQLGETRVRPDIVFRRKKIAVFIDGCFWHGCPRHGTRPKVNQHYWDPKIARNKARDRRNTRALRAAGWVVIRAWEHEPAPKVAARIGLALAASANGRS